MRESDEYSFTSGIRHWPSFLYHGRADHWQSLWLYSVMITISFLPDPRAICPFSENLVINSMKNLVFLKINPSQAFLHLHCPTLGTQKSIKLNSFSQHPEVCFRRIGFGNFASDTGVSSSVGGSGFSLSISWMEQQKNNWFCVYYFPPDFSCCKWWWLKNPSMLRQNHHCPLSILGIYVQLSC